MAKGKNSAPGPITKALSAVIRHHMTDLRTNKSRLAEATGIARTTLGNIVDGKAVYDIEQLDRVCQALGQEIEDVLKDAAARVPARVLESGIRPIVRLD